MCEIVAVSTIKNGDVTGDTFGEIFGNGIVEIARFTGSAVE